MKKQKWLVFVLVLPMLLVFNFAALGETDGSAVKIHLSDSGITVDGEAAETNPDAAVYIANDIVYYESGRDLSYGEGSEADAHNPEDAEAHTVVHIAQPGTYSLSGTLSRGQIAVDLGEDAPKDPDAVVNLILDGADISCEVAPAIIFYNVYECGEKDEETASKDVNTCAAGANLIIADGSVNAVNGSYVASIYDPESVVLSEDGSKVEDADELHEYDGAVYSCMSMNISGGSENTGSLTINAENEGLCSELHLTVNGGSINIKSGNDGINANEDNLSVVTVNGGSLDVTVAGETGEGDGIDSNGWIVINGGSVTAAACSDSADAGIDADCGIHINGGTVLASGHMLDQIENGGQNYAVFSFAQQQKGGDALSLRCEEEDLQLEIQPVNDFSVLVYSSEELVPGSYTLYIGDQQLAGRSGVAKAGMPEMPRGGFFGDDRKMQLPEGREPFEGKMKPGKAVPPDGVQPPDNMQPSQWEGRPEEDGQNFRARFDFPADATGTGETVTQFEIGNGANMFSGIAESE